MPTVGWNRANWGDAQRWETEWREGYAWGSREVVQAHFDRFVKPVVPLHRPPRVLEIGCGMGRFTEVLLDIAEHVHGIDVAEHCVESCRERFPDRFTATLTDGKTLPEGPFELVVSWDSLVHAEFNAVSSYIRQAQDRLVPGGHLAIHHANREHFPTSRAKVTGTMVARLIVKLPCLELVSQTLFRWEAVALVDCFTVAKRIEG